VDIAVTLNSLTAYLLTNVQGNSGVFTIATSGYASEETKAHVEHLFGFVPGSDSSPPGYQSDDGVLDGRSDFYKWLNRIAPRV